MPARGDRVPTRSIVCVDGTWCGPDGAHGNRTHNITNIYRLCSAIKQGQVVDSSGKTYHQQKKYFSGIAAEDGISYSERFVSGIFGGPCVDQIREVYEHCCRSTRDENDEIWLFGFSRGAFVVRAVAGLLHYIRALTSAGQDGFRKDFKAALEVYKKFKKQNKLGDGQSHMLFQASTRPAPIIRFVGVFDTVKAMDDNHLYDITFNPSTQHMRHAIALNEDRRRFEPEYMYPNFNDRAHALLQKTFIQAWFVGAHIDIGGSTDKDGLSLYPLQWMLLESRRCGLALEFDGTFGGRINFPNPLQLTGLQGDGQTWKCSTSNGLTIEMMDIRKTHEDPASKGKYDIHLHRASGGGWIRRHRQPFDEDGQLQGNCPFELTEVSCLCKAPQGTIIHPSVYLILDQFMHISLDAKHFPFYQFLHQWRSQALGSKDDLRDGCFWNTPADSNLAEIPEELGAVRILVCGNTGVGKSSLINKVFGVEKTPVAHRSRGVHEIEEPITWEGRPDLVVHDSAGFEAGGKDELDRVERFLKNKSVETKVEERLHVIWYCLPALDSRPNQHAQKLLFEAFSKYAQDIPVVFIATRKDEFLDSKIGEERRNLQRRNQPISWEAIDKYAADKLQERLLQITEDLHGVCNFDSIVAVSKDDDDSIKHLSETTVNLFDDDRVRLLYIRAQAEHLDQKIDLAQTAVMGIYRKALISSSSVGAIPMAPSTNRAAVSADVCQAIVTSFGLTSITPTTVLEICKFNIWDDVGSNFRTTITEISAATGLTLTVLSGMPFFLIPMATNIPLVVVATSRLMLMLACDVILILTRAFRKAVLKSITKPEKTDVEEAAREYSAHCKEVHRRIKKGLAHVVRCYRAGEVDSLVTKVIKDFKPLVLQETGSGLPSAFRRESTETRVSMSPSYESSSSTLDETFDKVGLQ